MSGKLGVVLAESIKHRTGELVMCIQASVNRSNEVQLEPRCSRLRGCV